MVDTPSQRPVDPTAKPAVETTKLELSTEEWVDLGPGPMLISSDGNIVYSISANLPRHPIREGFPVLATEPPVEIRTTAHIWSCVQACIRLRCSMCRYRDTIMKRLILVSLALLAASASFAAVATVKTTLNGATWVDLGAGPAMVGASGAVVFAIGDTTPTIPIQQGFVLGVNPQCVNTTSHIWGMSQNTFAAWAFVATVAGC